MSKKATVAYFSPYKEDRKGYSGYKDAKEIREAVNSTLTDLK